MILMGPFQPGILYDSMILLMDELDSGGLTYALLPHLAIFASTLQLSLIPFSPPF